MGCDGMGWDGMGCARLGMIRKKGCVMRGKRMMQWHVAAHSSYSIRKTPGFKHITYIHS